jgi:hypothetical protein
VPRPSFQPTDEQRKRVKSLSAVGMSHDDICRTSADDRDTRTETATPGRRSCDHEQRPMGLHRERLAFKTIGRDLESLAGSDARAKIHEPANRTRTDLARDRSPEPFHRKRAAKPENPHIPFREGSKAAQVHALLVRREGVTLGEVEQLTGWQRHTIRAFLSSIARKHVFRVRSFGRAGERTYRVQS